ncbi:hypothetical protein [Plantibacter sp. YIM 135249]|uniref:hypothetical protein n=1 Tax=Plantibacter sp. YIM 135249 TaxID=3423918 RepID=UPI003D32525A
MAISISLTMAGCFLAYQGIDEVTFNGASTAVVVQAIPQEATRAATIDAISRAAQEADVSIVKVTADPDDIDHSRIISTFARAKPDFAPFSTQLHTVIKPIAESATMDLRGIYLIDGSDAQGRDIAASLTSAGYSAQSESRSPQSFVIGKLSQNPALMTIGVAGLLALILALVSASSQAQKRLAVKAVHGFSENVAILGETASVAREFCLWVGALGVLGTVALLFVNSWNQFAGFVAFTLPAVAVLFLLTIGAAAISLYLLPAAKLPELLKGKRPVLYLALAAALVQCVTTISLLSAFTSASAQTQIAAKASAEIDQWRASTDLLTLRFSPNVTERSYQALQSTFLDLIRRLEPTGGIVLSAHPSAIRNSDYGADGNSIIVNNEFVRRQSILDSDGRPVEPVQESPGHLTLLIPEHLGTRTDEITETYRAEAGFQAELDGRSPPAVDIEVILLRSGQSIFNFSQDLTLPAQLDPVIAVIPAASGILSRDFYLAKATSGGVLVSDTSDAMNLLQNEGILDSLASIDSAADFALDALQSLQSQLRGLRLSIAFTALVLLLSTTVLVAAYCQGHKQAIFSRFSNGWPFLSTHRWFIVSTTAGTSVVLLTSLAFARTTGGLMWATVILCCETILVLSLLRFAERRLHGDMIKRY